MKDKEQAVFLSDKSNGIVTREKKAATLVIKECIY